MTDFLKSGRMADMATIQQIDAVSELLAEQVYLIIFEEYVVKCPEELRASVIAYRKLQRERGLPVRALPLGMRDDLTTMTEVELDAEIAKAIGA